MKKSLLTIGLLLFLAPLLQGQEAGAGWFARTVRKLSTRLTTPDRVYDTTYVYQLKEPWGLSLDVDLIRTGLEMRSDSGLQNADPTTHHSAHLRPDLYKKIGAGISYGTLQLAHTFEVGKNSARRNKYTRLALGRPRFGISFQYYRISEFLDGSVHFDDNPARDFDFSSRDPGEMRNLVIDAFYFFNPDRFAYSAINGLNVMQRRSGGSWMLRACYNQGEFRLDPGDPLVLGSYDHIGRLRSGDFSVGVGYSFNWVPLHTAPNGNSLKGLRNLTLNATLVPGLTVYNHLHSTAYTYPDTGTPVEGKTYRAYTYGLPGLTLAARAGASFTWERFQLSSIFTFNRSVFRGGDTVNMDEITRERYRTQTRGAFFDVTARIQFAVRF